VIDEFPLMPTKQCPDCADAAVGPKKIMFFPKHGAYCTEHASQRSRESRAHRRGGVTPGYEYNRQPLSPQSVFDNSGPKAGR
jgi:hypothetical protein